MPLPTPAQKGTALFSLSPPKFANHRVVGGTWKDSDALKHEMMEDEDEEVFNINFWDPGFDASCTLVSTAEHNISKGDDLTEIAGSPNPDRVWIVTDVDRSNFGKRALKQDVKLIFRDKLQPA